MLQVYRQRLIYKLKNEGEKNIRVLSRILCPGYETVICDLQSGLIPDNTFDGGNSISLGLVQRFREKIKISIYRQITVNATVRLADLAAASE